jgi:DNA-binding beta-propeller fold protein YncE
MIDTNPSSPTFNSVIRTLNAGLNSSDPLAPWSGTATPDGKYVYVSYEDTFNGDNSLAIFDVVNGGTATILDLFELGASPYQFDMQATSDGTSLVLNGVSSTGFAGQIGVFDISANPKNPTLVTNIVGTPLQQVGGAIPLFFYSYQVVGNRLFALDLSEDLLVAFNFDRAHNNFSQLGAYHWRGDVSGNPYIAVSPDGGIIYVPFGGDDMVSVFDANLLAQGQQPFITNLAAFHQPDAVAVNPVAQSRLVSPSGPPAEASSSGTFNRLGRPTTVRTDPPPGRDAGSQRSDEVRAPRFEMPDAQ